MKPQLKIEFINFFKKTITPLWSKCVFIIIDGEDICTRGNWQASGSSQWSETLSKVALLFSTAFSQDVFFTITLKIIEVPREVSCAFFLHRLVLMSFKFQFCCQKWADCRLLMVWNMEPLWSNHQAEGLFEQSRLRTLLVLRIFIHFHFLPIFWIAYSNFQHCSRFFHEITMFSSKKISFNNFFYLIATYGARVRGSVFKMKLRVLAW